MYCTLLLCTHHRQTCALAKEGNEQPVGFVSGYRLPEDSENFFVWQVAIDEHARGRGLARKLIWEILGRPACRGVRNLRTTITMDNNPSWAMFRGLAESLQADSERRELFDRKKHFGGQHPSEHELIIGPFTFLPATRKESNE